MKLQKINIDLITLELHIDMEVETLRLVLYNLKGKFTKKKFIEIEPIKLFCKKDRQIIIYKIIERVGDDFLFNLPN